MAAEDPLREVRENENLAKWGEAPVPHWLIDEHIAQILKHDEDKGVFEPMSLDRTCGPAVVWGFTSLVGLTYFLAALPVVGTYIARCPAVEKSYGFATYPELLLWIIFFAPLTCIVLAAQWKITTFVLVPMVQQIRKHKVHDADKPLPINAWFIVGSAFTVFNLLDQMTNALFTAKIWATRHCYGYQFIEHTWQETLGQSKALFWIKGLGLDFACFTAGAYFIQLIVQPIVALCYSVPISNFPWNTDYSIITDAEKQVAHYKTLSDNPCDTNDRTTHSSAAVVLAEVNRMEVVVAEDLHYRKALCKSLQVDVMAKLHEPGASQEDINNAKYESCDKALEVGIAATARGLARFTLRGLLQNAVQVNLQVSMAAISKAVSGPDGVDLFNAISIGVTIVSMFFDVPDIYASLHFSQEVMNQVDAVCQKDQDETLRRSLQRKLNHMWWLVLRLWIYGFIYAGLAFLALMKLVMAVGVCEDGTWNLTSFFDGHWGCTKVLPPTNLTVCPVGEYLCA
eukprot:CAMPEP_0204555092 /NCGR_PEP_ID=MMETSP0661-20131031/28578_1 /ASSEMBLY_ACC=CAM_ASM_000606 /TAXON_ID=109239 /ORGANISM="Alexandrium margalefi, Strain AMGDE01CS-322" /LENGTH=510 /DNA_ID=CAMNT_0051562179 /DNA_START=78 /DNA_END=1610 /DNA_ORIENTATION=-